MVARNLLYTQLATNRRWVSDGEPSIDERGGIIMNWTQIEGQWHQIAGQVKSKWGKLTDDDLKNVAGKQEQLVGKVQERYGVLKEEAEKQAGGHH